MIYSEKDYVLFEIAQFLFGTFLLIKLTTKDFAEQLKTNQWILDLLI